MHPRGMAKANRSRVAKLPRSLICSFRLRAGTSQRDAELLAGMVTAAVEDAASTYRALKKTNPFDSAVASAEVSVETLH